MNVLLSLFLNQFYKSKKNTSVNSFWKQTECVSKVFEDKKVQTMHELYFCGLIKIVC